MQLKVLSKYEHAASSTVQVLFTADLAAPSPISPPGMAPGGTTLQLAATPAEAALYKTGHVYELALTEVAPV